MVLLAVAVSLATAWQYEPTRNVTLSRVVRRPSVVAPAFSATSIATATARGILSDAFGQHILIVGGAGPDVVRAASSSSLIASENVELRGTSYGILSEFIAGGALPASLLPVLVNDFDMTVPAAKILATEGVRLSTASLADQLVSLFSFEGETAFVATQRSNSVFYMSMCSAGYTERKTDVILRLDLDSLAFEIVWQGARVAVNASCVATTLNSRDVIAIVGGVEPDAPRHSDLVVSTFDPTTSVLSVDIGRVTLMPNATVVASPSLCALSAPLIFVATRDGTTCIVELQSVDVGSRIEVASVFLPRLPTELTIGEQLATGQFGNTLFVVAVDAKSPGVAASFSLAPLSTHRRQSSATLRANDGWSTEPLAGSPFVREGATLKALTLPGIGDSLLVYAFGGVLATACSKNNNRSISGETAAACAAAFGQDISFSTVNCIPMPSTVSLPYSLYNTAVVVASDVNTSTGVTTATVHIEIIRPSPGQLAFSTSAACSPLVAPAVEYNGSATTAMQLTLPSVIGLDRPLFLCYSDGSLVSLRSSAQGLMWSGVLFTVANSFQPIALAPANVVPGTPSPSSGNHSHPHRDNDAMTFTRRDWILLGLGICTTAIIITILVIFRTSFLLRGNGAGAGKGRGMSRYSSIRGDDIDDPDGFGYGSANGDEADSDQGESSFGSDRNAHPHISTNSHSGRYAIVEALKCIDGSESPVCFLVRRKKDKHLLVMKFIPCEGDLQRLTSMREFEVMQMVHGHPNAVNLVDMFMSYTFSDRRFDGSGGRFSHGIRKSDTTPTPTLRPQSGALLSSSESPSYGGLSAAVSSVLRESDGAVPAMRSVDFRERRNSFNNQNASFASTAAPGNVTAVPNNSNNNGGSGYDDANPGSAAAAASPPRPPVSASRYVCLVVDYHKRGNIAQWCVEYVRQNQSRARGRSFFGSFGSNPDLDDPQHHIPITSPTTTYSSSNNVAQHNQTFFSSTRSVGSAGMGGTRRPSDAGLSSTRASGISPRNGGATAATSGLQGVIPEQIILSVVFQLCSILKYMHHECSPPIVHKGITLGNILVTADLNTKKTFLPVCVSDFGFSALGNFQPPISRTEVRDEDARSMRSNASMRMGAGMCFNDSLNSPSTDLWCVGCVIVSLTTMMIGPHFPALGEALTLKNRTESIDQIYKELRTELRLRGYSRELTNLALALLHVEDRLRPSAATCLKMFERQSDGTLCLNC